MDLDLDILVLVAMLLVTFLTMRYLAVRDAAERYRHEKEARLSALNRQKAIERGQNRMNGRTMQEIQYPQQRPAGPREEPEEERFDVGPWVAELLKSFGIDPDTIYEETMPDSLKAYMPLMPMIKTYIGAQGGLSGIAAKLQAENAAGGPPGSGDGNGL